MQSQRTAPQPSTVRSWVLAIRPPTLLVGLGPVLLGIAFSHLALGAQGSVRPSLFASIAALLLVVLLQSAANLVNDAKDAEKGIDKGERLGPLRVVHAGLLPLNAVKRAYHLCFALAAAIALSLFWKAGDALTLEVAGLCALAAYAYTAGPFPLAYFALGEAVALIFFGPIAVMGTSYLHTHQVDLQIAFWGMGTGFIAAAIMAINNFRDRRGDRAAGKHTLATLLAPFLAQRLPLLFLAFSIALLLGYGLTHGRAALSCVLSLLLGGMAWILIRPLLAGPPAALNQALKRTALFNLAYALGFTALVIA